jgi:hypothetical protein
MGHKEEGRGKYWFGPLGKTFRSAEREESALVVVGLDALPSCAVDENILSRAKTRKFTLVASFS